MFTLDTVAGNRAGVMSRLATTLNTLTLVKQSSCYYALVKTVKTATQIQSPFGFVGTRYMKAHNEGHRCNIRWTLKCLPSSKSLIQSPERITISPPELLPTLLKLLGISHVRCRLSVFATSKINVCNALKDPEFRVAYCLCTT